MTGPAERGFQERPLPNPVILPENLDRDRALAAVFSPPQAEFIIETYPFHHGGPDEVGPQTVPLMERIRELQRTNQWDEASKVRILNGSPQNADEEEYMRLFNIKGAITVLTWSYLNATSLPPEVIELFGRDLHGGVGDYDVLAVWGLREWKEKNPVEAAKPIPDNEAVGRWVNNLVDRIEQYTKFCNKQLPLPAVFKILFPGGFNESEWKGNEKRKELWKLLEPYGADLSRFLIVSGLLSILGQTELLDRLEIGVGIQERSTP